MVEIRGYRPEDLDDLYRIALATGDAGGDASALYRDSRLIGHVYAGPYATLLPETVLVAEDSGGVAGYILGAVDTRAFEIRQEAEWWPALRRRYPDPVSVPPEYRTPDQQRCHRIHHPLGMPDAIVGDHPSHLHINLLPRQQRRGVGRRLVERWLGLAQAMGSHGVHLGVNSANRAAVTFYRANGFRELDCPVASAPLAIWFVIGLNPSATSDSGR
ncbi:GCN5-related N-acetyltransferase [alpha proteobacterium BAL199]|jgi:ribosomal protein S18 acetylase RimI-like enzyme|nr:GCN5-related N-acetyltransferase [alpha proteobacterium BAL199]